MAATGTAIVDGHAGGGVASLPNKCSIRLRTIMARFTGHGRPGREQVSLVQPVSPLTAASLIAQATATVAVAVTVALGVLAGAPSVAFVALALAPLASAPLSARLVARRLLRSLLAAQAEPPAGHRS
jgi:hypothetical protein